MKRITLAFLVLAGAAVAWAQNQNSLRDGNGVPTLLGATTSQPFETRRINIDQNGGLIISTQVPVSVNVTSNNTSVSTITIVGQGGGLNVSATGQVSVNNWVSTITAFTQFPSTITAYTLAPTTFNLVGQGSGLNVSATGQISVNNWTSTTSASVNNWISTITAYTAFPSTITAFTLAPTTVTLVGQGSSLNTYVSSGVVGIATSSNVVLIGNQVSTVNVVGLPIVSTVSVVNTPQVSTFTIVGQGGGLNVSATGQMSVNNFPSTMTVYSLFPSTITTYNLAPTTVTLVGQGSSVNVYTSSGVVGISTASNTVTLGSQLGTLSVGATVFVNNLLNPTTVTIVGQGGGLNVSATGQISINNWISTVTAFTAFPSTITAYTLFPATITAFTSQSTTATINGVVAGAIFEIAPSTRPPLPTATTGYFPARLFDGTTWYNATGGGSTSINNWVSTINVVAQGSGLNVSVTGQVSVNNWTSTTSASVNNWVSTVNVVGIPIITTATVSQGSTFNIFVASPLPTGTNSIGNVGVSSITGQAPITVQSFSVSLSSAFISTFSVTIGQFNTNTIISSTHTTTITLRSIYVDTDATIYWTLHRGTDPTVQVNRIEHGRVTSTTGRGVHLLDGIQVPSGTALSFSVAADATGGPGEAKVSLRWSE